MKSELTNMDRWIFSCLGNLVATCKKSYENFEIRDAVLACRTFWVNEMCDIYLVSIQYKPF